MKSDLPSMVKRCSWEIHMELLCRLSSVSSIEWWTERLGATRWCPSSLAKLVNITPISLWFMLDISIVNGVYKPTNITGGAPPCTDIGEGWKPFSWRSEGDAVHVMRSTIGRRLLSDPTWQFWGQHWRIFITIGLSTVMAPNTSYKYLYCNPIYRIYNSIYNQL